MHRLISTLVVAVALAMTTAMTVEAQPLQAGPTWSLSIEQSCPGHYQGIAYYRREVWRYERRMNARITRATYAEHNVLSCEGVIPHLNRWRNLSYQRAKQYRAYLKAMRSTGIPPGRPPHYNDWICIHGFEAAWNDPNPPYYGGLQMDLGFQRTYGAKLLATKGTADHWTPLEQMWVAERAFSGYGGYKGRGFTPWPNTARYCGLL